MHSSHYFFAMTLPDEVKQHLLKMSERLKGICPFKSWVHHKDYHITLAFLGNAKQEQLKDAVTHVNETLKNFNAFSLQLNQAGIFGRPASPRILWVNTLESSSLLDLRERVFTACEKAGFELETRPFKPHITMARKWVGEENFHLPTVEEKLGTLLPGSVFLAAEAALYRTHLNRTPKYEKVESFTFTQ